MPKLSIYQSKLVPRQATILFSNPLRAPCRSEQIWSRPRRPRGSYCGRGKVVTGEKKRKIGEEMSRALDFSSPPKFFVAIFPSPPLTAPWSSRIVSAASLSPLSSFSGELLGQETRAHKATGKSFEPSPREQVLSCDRPCDLVPSGAPNSKVKKQNGV